jgi:S-adenosylmethionine:tRNA ribosyltransferase-isomerase
MDNFLQTFDYDLPVSLIAQEPVTPRDNSRLLVIDRKTEAVSHHRFFELPDLLNENTILVLNDTKVYPARLFGKKPNGVPVEVLLIKKLNDGSWEALCSPGIKPGTMVDFGQFHAEVLGWKERAIIIKPDVSDSKFLELIEKIGTVPTPPYIRSHQSQEVLKQTYQTVFAKETGSAAAPTAGLHFTNALFEKLHTKGIETVSVTLHVGLGTFAPVDKNHIKEKKLHSETFEITKEEAKKINQSKKNGKRIIAVGTTAVRALESAADENGIIHPFCGETAIFISPGFTFKATSGMITNFHVPKSSLLMLVSAFCSYPQTEKRFIDFKNSLMGTAYTAAIDNNYRFYSFGDACFIT